MHLTLVDWTAVVAYHVLYHGTRADTGRALAEIGRVLGDEGLFVGTLLSTRTWKHGEGRRLEDRTYVQERGPEAGDVALCEVVTGHHPSVVHPRIVGRGTPAAVSFTHAS